MKKKTPCTTWYQVQAKNLLRYHKGNKRSYKLTDEDVVFLASHTNYNTEEIKEWFRSIEVHNR